MDNIDQIYNPSLSGIGSMVKTRNFLIEKGMSPKFADSLAHRYILRLEN